MATLAPSLRRLFNELDSAWPKRDRRTDGWYRNCRWVDHGTDHCPTSDGMVHAIDIDKDGINADWVTYQLTKYSGVIRYVIWNRHIYQNKNGFREEKYTGTSNPHTDHIHVSIEHTNHAEQYSGGYGIGIGGAIGAIVGGAILATPTNWNAEAAMGQSAGHLGGMVTDLMGTSLAIKGLRK